MWTQQEVVVSGFTVDSKSPCDPMMCVPPTSNQVGNRVNASTFGGGGHEVKEILARHPTVPRCTTTIGKPQGHNGSGTPLLMPPIRGGVLFLQPRLEIWCLTTRSTIYYKTYLKTTGLVVRVVYPLCNGALTMPSG